MQDVMAATAPAVSAFDAETGRRQMADQMASQANVNFDKRVMSEALPITRMLNTDGSIDKEAIKGAGKGFTDPHAMWEALNKDMPGNRGIDPVVFQEKYQMGKQLYDMNLMNQIGQMGESGMSEKEIRNALKENTELYDYALNNSIIPRDDPTDWGSIGKGAAKFGVGAGAFYGASKAITSRIPVAPSKELFRTLRESGFERKGQFGVKKVSDNALARKHGLDRVDKRPTTKSGKPDKRFKAKKGGLTPDSKKELNKIKAARDKLIRENPTLKKAIGGNKTAGGKILSKPSSILKRGLMGAMKAGAKAKGPGYLRGAAALGGGLLAATAGEEIFEKVFGK